MSPRLSRSDDSVYEVRVLGHLDDVWTERFPGCALTREPEGHTRVVGPIPDQAALYALLRSLRDLGVPLLSVRRADEGSP